MAKGKHAAALFEVIQSSRFQKNRPDPLVTPRWWFKRKPKSEAASFTPASLAIVAPPVVETATLAVAEPPTPSAPKRPIPGVDLELDPDRHQISFKLSYNSAIITAFTVLVLIGMAYIIGKSMRHAPIAATNSPSTDELRTKPAHPDVLDVRKGPGPGDELIAKKPALGDAQEASAKQDNSGNDLPKPPPSSNDVDRVIGKQYVVIQSYTDEKAANDIAVFLAKNNVPCSVVKALPNWGRADMYSIVGTTGFDRIRSNPDYEHYEANIAHLGEQLAANGKFKKFEPHAYRWKGVAG